MVLEESPEEFFERFREAAFEAEFLPVPEGYPVLELPVGPHLLAVFDRGPIAERPRRGPLLLHGVAEEAVPETGTAALRPLKGGGLLARGRVAKAYGQGFYLFETLVPLLAHAPEPWEENAWLKVRFAPPLMGFRP